MRRHTLAMFPVLSAACVIEPSRIVKGTIVYREEAVVPAGFMDGRTIVIRGTRISNQVIRFR